MNESKKSKLLKVAVNGVLAASVASLVFAGTAHAQAKAGDKGANAGKVKCEGANACKGKGDCGGKGHSCAGKNTCKGQGWNMMTKDDCTKNKGTVSPDKK